MELPEIKTAAAQLNKHFPKGLFLEGVVIHPDMRNTLQEESSGNTAFHTRGEFLGVTSVGKYLELHFMLGGGEHIHTIFPRFGNVLIADSRPSDYVAEWAFKGVQQKIYLTGRRSFARIYPVLASKRGSSYSRAILGPDADSIPYDVFCYRVSQFPNRCWRDILLDQRILAGIGNIYVSEILWACGTPQFSKDPKWKEFDHCVIVHGHVIRILQDAIAAGGSSVQSYLTPEGTRGTYQEQHQVYGKKGQACPRCGTPIAYAKHAGRGAYYCPKCQSI